MALASMAFESHAASRAVAVCGTKSAFDHTMVSPAAAVTTAGTNPKFEILTTCARGAGCEQAAIAPASSAGAIASRPNLELTYLVIDAWMLLARSRCAANAGRTFTISALRSAFWELGINVLSIASSTAWWYPTSLSM